MLIISMQTINDDLTVAVIFPDVRSKIICNIYSPYKRYT